MKLTDLQLAEARAINTLIKEETLKFDLVRGNTLLVRGGKQWVKTQEDLLNLLKGVQTGRLNDAAQAMGLKEGEKYSVDLETGEICPK